MASLEKENEMRSNIENKTTEKNHQHFPPNSNSNNITIVKEEWDKKDDEYEMTLKCSLCDFSSKSKQAIKLHVLTPHFKEPFQCDICSQRFKRKSMLRKHIDKIHTNNAVNPKKYSNAEILTEPQSFCDVPSCTNRALSGFSAFSRFSKNPILKEKWMDILQINSEGR